MSVRTDVVNLIVNVGGDKAKDELNQLRKKSADLRETLKGLKDTEAVLNAQREIARNNIQVTTEQFGKNSKAVMHAVDSYKRKTLELTEHRKEISNTKAAIAELDIQINKQRKSIGLEEMSIKQLNAELRQLSSVRDVMNPLTQEFKDTQKQIDAILARKVQINNGMMEMGSINAKAAIDVKKNTHQLSSLSQVIREIPAFTYSAQTGILGLSNNLPILMDNFKAVATSVNANTGKINGNIGALKIFMTSMFSFTNIFSLAIGLITIFSDKIFSAFNKAKKESEDFADSIAAVNKALQSNEVKEAMVNVMNLQSQIELAKKGFIDKDKVVKLYNETIGKTTGLVGNLEQAERMLEKNAEAYVRMTMYKTAANLAMEESAKNVLLAEQARQKSLEDFSNAFLDAQTSQIRSQEQFENEQKRTQQNRKARKDEEIKLAEDAAAKQNKIAQDLNHKAAAIAKDMHLDFAQSIQERNKQSDKGQREALSKLGSLKDKILSIREELRLAAMDDDQREFAQIKIKYEKLIKEATGYYAQIVELKKLEGEELSRLQRKIDKENHEAVIDAWWKEYRTKVEFNEKELKAQQAFADRMEEEEKKDPNSIENQALKKLEKDVELSQEQLRIEQLKKEGRAQIWRDSLSLYQDINNLMSQKDRNDLNDELEGNEKKKKSFEQMLKRKQITQAQYDREVAKIDAQSDSRRQFYALKEFRRAKAFAYVTAIINGAQSITEIWAKYGDVPYIAAILTAISAAAVGVQIAAITSQQPPQAERGMLIKGKRHSQGGTLIEAEDGEVILSRNTVANNAGIVNELLHSSMHRNGAPVYQWSNPTFSTERVIPQAKNGAAVSSTAASKAQVDQLSQQVQSLTTALTGSTSTSTESSPSSIRAYVVLSDIKSAQSTYDSLRKNSGLNQ